MKKFIYLAFAVLALLVSSCSKDDNEGSTSLDGDWYIYVGNNNSSNKGYRWFPSNQCSQKSVWRISGNRIHFDWYDGRDGTCKLKSIYYEYTANNGVFDMVVAADSPTDRGKRTSVNYRMIGKELIFSWKNGLYGDEIQVLHKKGVDYSYLDPLVGYWQLTKASVGSTTVFVKPNECLSGSVVACVLGLTIYLDYPENGRCVKTTTNFTWKNEGGRYSGVSDSGEHVTFDMNFENNNQTLIYRENTKNGLMTLYFNKVR